MSDFLIQDNVLVKYTGTGERVITIPEGVVIIGENAFNYIDEDIDYTTSEVITDEGTFILDERGFECNSHIKQVAFPTTLRVIRKKAFYRCSLRTVHLPEGVKNIGISAFEHNEIKELKLPNTLRNIEERAFIFNHLNSVIIPEGVKFIKKHAFAYNNMQTAEIENIVPLISIHNKAFVNGKGEADIVFSMY